MDTGMPLDHTILNTNHEFARVAKMDDISIMHHYGKSYYYASKFIVSEKKYAIYALYKLVRVPDVIVDQADTTLSKAQKREYLQAIHNHWRYVVHNHLGDDPIFGSAYRASKKYYVKKEYIAAFFHAMEADISKNRYETFQELCNYMYGSAEVVGLMMTQILGYRDEKAIPYARLLGRAMQYANFLRDVAEDYTILNRIYLPTQELQKFGLTHADIIRYIETKIIDEKRISYMRHAIADCDDMFERSMSGIKYLNRFSRQGIYLASRLYQSILRKIEKIGYNIFAKSARTTGIEKFSTVTRYLIDRSWLSRPDADCSDIG